MTVKTYDTVLYAAFLISFSYFIVLTVYYLVLALIGLLDTGKRMEESKNEDYPLLFSSSFAIPISIVIPAHNEEEWIRDCVMSVLNLDYPKFEVIVVDDYSSDATPKILNDMLGLYPIDMLYTKHYKDGKVETIFKSSKYDNVTVMRKSASALKKAGTVNAGLNLARYEYVCALDADTILEPDALLRVMAQVQKDPEHIIGIGSYFGLSNGMKVENGRILEHNFSYHPIIAYQNLEYIRSFIGNRIAWSRFNAIPVVAGGFGVWRNDMLYDTGGYSAEFTCEDMELTFRAREYAFMHKAKNYKIEMMPYCAGWTEGPPNIKSLISQRERWQRVINETVEKYRHMICNPKYGAFAFFTLPYLVLYEIWGVFFEIASICFVAAGYIMKVLDIKVFLAFLALMLLSQCLISLLSIFVFVRSQRIFRMRYVAYLIVLSMAEFFWYRWILSAAKIVGTYRFLRHTKTFDQYRREKRSTF